jgi:hypothetical protein
MLTRYDCLAVKNGSHTTCYDSPLAKTSAPPNLDYGLRMTRRKILKLTDRVVIKIPGIMVSSSRSGTGTLIVDGKEVQTITMLHTLPWIRQRDERFGIVRYADRRKRCGLPAAVHADRQADA